MVRCCAITEKRRGATCEQADALREEEGWSRVKCAQLVCRHGLGRELPVKTYGCGLAAWGCSLYCRVASSAM